MGNLLDCGGADQSNDHSDWLFGQTVNIKRAKFNAKYFEAKYGYGPGQLPHELMFYEMSCSKCHQGYPSASGETTRCPGCRPGWEPCTSNEYHSQSTPLDADQAIHQSAEQTISANDCEEQQNDGRGTLAEPVSFGNLKPTKPDNETLGLDLQAEQ
jgi:hypothetical protein